MSLDHVRAVVLDMDGVIRIGKTAVPGTQRLIDTMQAKSIPGMILTNECRYTVETIREDFDAMGVRLPDEWKIYTSALSLRDFLIKQLNKKQVPFQLGIIGETGLVAAMKEVRALFPEVVRIADKNTDPIPVTCAEEKIYLIIGTVNALEIDHLNTALRWIRAGAKVVVTCPDIMDPELKEDFSISMPRHLLHMVRLNENTTYFSVGKPNAWMARAIRQQFPQLKMNQILYVGDTIQTDIVLAEEQDMTSALVLSGNTAKKDLAESIIEPDYVFQSVAELADAL